MTKHYAAPALMILAFVGCHADRPGPGHPVAAAAAAAPARAVPEEDYDLVEPLRCLAGSWGESSRQEWRVQLGVFDDPEGAARFVDSLTARGLLAERYAGVWLVGDNDEPQVVVSPEMAPDADTSAYRAVVGDAFLRRFRVWH
jgi:hypothetical protein